MGKKRYLYGLVAATEETDFGCIGLPVNGEPARVYTIVTDGVGAVVSEYSGPAKVLPLRKNLAPHHGVIRAVMAATTMVPMSFGHVATSEGALLRLLQVHREAVLAELSRLGGRVEMGLKVRWEVDNIFEYFVDLDPALAGARDQLFGRSSEPSQTEKIELGQLFEERLEREREEQTDRVLELLGPVAASVRVNPPKGMNAVMDLAFLVEQQRLDEVEAAVFRVAGTFPAEYTFDYNGPWAPFNFVELDLSAGEAA